MGLIVPSAMHPEQADQPIPYEWFVGIDWGSQQHQVCVLDRDRRLVGNGLWTMMAPVWHSWRPGCGPCRRANRSGYPWPSKCRVARLSKGWSNEASMSLRLTLSNLTGSEIVSVAGAKDDRRDAFVLA